MLEESKVENATACASFIDTSAAHDANINEQCNLGESTLQSTVHISHSNMIDTNMVLSDFALAHPSAHLSRETTTEIGR